MQCSLPMTNLIYANRFEILAMTVPLLVSFPEPEACRNVLCKATTLMMKPSERTSTTTGSTFNPGLSSVYNLNIVPELPPAPAALVDVGLAFLTVSLWSAAARRRMALRGPPGGELARAMLEVVAAFPEGAEESGPDSGPDVRGEDGRGAA